MLVDAVLQFPITLSCHHPFRLPDFLKGLDLYPQDENNIVGII